MWQEVERRGEKVFHKSRCCFRNKRSSLSPASRCVMLPGRYPDCSEGIVYFVKKKKKPTGNCLFMFCFVFFRFIFRQRGMTGNLNTIEKKPVVVKLSTLVSFFRAQSSSSSPCVCVCALRNVNSTRGRPFDTHRARTGQMFPLQLSIHFFLAFHIRARLCCVCARLGRRRCALFSSSADLLRTRAAEWANKLTRAPLHHILHLMVLITKGSTRLETESIWRRLVWEISISHGNTKLANNRPKRKFNELHFQTIFLLSWWNGASWRLGINGRALATKVTNQWTGVTPSTPKLIDSARKREREHEFMCQVCFPQFSKKKEKKFPNSSGKSVKVDALAFESNAR